MCKDQLASVAQTLNVLSQQNTTKFTIVAHLSLHFKSHMIRSRWLSNKPPLKAKSIF